MSRPFLRGASLISVIGLIAGCAALPAGGPPKTLASAASVTSRRSLAAPARAWPGDGWWRAYDDAQLDGLVDEALARSPDVAQARARLDKANAVAGQARAALVPALEGRANASENKQSYNFGIPPLFVPKGYNDAGTVTLNLSYQLDLWGENRAALAAATSDARAAQADAAEAQLALSTSVAAAYADLERLWAEREVAQRAVQSRSETLDLVSRRVANGLDTQGELGQARSGQASARADLAAIDEEVALDRNQIAALLGAGPDRGLAIVTPVAATLTPFGLPARLAIDLVGRRPDLTAARWRAQSAAKRIHQAQAKFYPNVNLAAYIGYQSFGLANLFASGSGIGQSGPAVTLPIFEGGRLRAGLRGARADYDEAVAVYDKTLVQAVREVADAAASERALTVRLKESGDALTASEDAYRIARLRYDGGLANYQAVLLAEDAVLQDRRAVADLRARALTLDIQLVRALGGGFDVTPQ